MRTTSRHGVLGAAVLAVASCAAPARDARPQPGVSARPAPIVRRLTVVQYRNAAADLLGSGLAVAPLEQEPRTGGFSTTGARQVATSAYGVEQYLAAADALARQVFADPVRRQTLVGCVPAAAVDRGCAQRFFAAFGRSAFRRPLSEQELARFVALAAAASERRRDFWEGLRVGTTALLASPSFVYLTEGGRSLPDGRGRFRLTSWELAARLSFFLWNTTPDQILLDAAAQDELADDAAVRRHAQRLLDAPRGRAGLRCFFVEMLRLDAAAHIARSRTRFPRMSRTLGPAMQEETLRVLEHNVFETRTDFRALLTTRETFVDAELAAIYGLDGVPPEAGFVEVSLPGDGPRRGLLGHASFLAGNASTDKTSPTARGKFVREVLLCQDVPAPPPNVDTNLPPVPKGEFKTVRERLEDHRTDVGCSKCHKFIDSIGLGFERFDLFGEYREREGEHAIDPSGDVDGRRFADPAALGEMLAADERVPACMIRNLYRHATGRADDQRDEPLITELTAAFRASGYRLFDAIITLVTSEGFLYVR